MEQGERSKMKLYNSYDIELGENFNMELGEYKNMELAMT